MAAARLPATSPRRRCAHKAVCAVHSIDPLTLALHSQVQQAPLAAPAGAPRPVAAAMPQRHPLGVQPHMAHAQPAQPRFSSGGGNTLGSGGGSGQSRLLDKFSGPSGSGRPGTSGGRPAAAAVARPDIDPEILALQLSEIDSMLAAVAEAPPEVLEPALELLEKIYTAIINKPAELKVRRIRWMNAKVQQHLAGVPVAQDFLVASGFSIVQRPVEGGGPDEQEDVILFEDGSSITLLTEARTRLTRALALSRSAPRSTAAGSAEDPRPTSLSSDPSAEEALPASPTRNSGNVGSVGLGTSTHTHTSADFAAPGTPCSPQAVAPAGWQTFGDSAMPPAPASGGDDWALGGTESSSERGGGVDTAWGNGESDAGGGAGYSDTDTGILQRMDGLVLSTRGADKAVLIPALELMLKIAGGILENPGEEKVRRIKTAGNAFQKIAIMGSLTTLLETAGFVSLTEHGEEVLRFPQSGSLYLLAEMRSFIARDLKLLKPATAPDDVAATTPPARDRELRVFVRGEGGGQVDAARFQVPDDCFEIRAEDVRAQMAAAAQKNMMMTKTMREATKPKYLFALVRVRLPDGFIIQGKFRPSEKIRAVVSWVDSCLLTPDRAYHLSTMPPVQKVTDKGCVDRSLSELDLVPAILFNLFWDDGINDGVQQPAILDSVMMKAEILRADSALMPPNVSEKPKWLFEREAAAMAGVGGAGGEDGKKVPAWMQKR